MTVRSTALFQLHSSVLNTNELVYAAPATGFRIILKTIELAITGAHTVQLALSVDGGANIYAWHAWNTASGKNSEHIEPWMVLFPSQRIYVWHDGGTIDAFGSGTALVL